MSGNIISGDITSVTNIATTGLLALGGVDGFVVKYSTTTAVAVTSGFIECNGVIYQLTADTTHTMTSLAAGFDIHYIYIDASASSEPNAVIIDSTTDPTYSPTKRGWYNGNDRCIGLCYSVSGAATILAFGITVLNDKNIRLYLSFPDDTNLRIAENMNPNGGWQTPNTRESSTILPTNANEIYLWMGNTDAGSTGEIAAIQAELATSGGPSRGHFYSGFNVLLTRQAWVPLGASRNVRLAGADNDDNGLGSVVNGCGYSR
jgi:hypothetical protein